MRANGSTLLAFSFMSRTAVVAASAASNSPSKATTITGLVWEGWSTSHSSRSTAWPKTRTGAAVGQAGKR